jgi:excisionase family DNA binding protein
MLYNMPQKEAAALNPLLGVHQVAEILGLHPLTVRNAIRDGRLHAIDVSPEGSGRRTLRVKQSEVGRFIELRGVR